MVNDSVLILNNNYQPLNVTNVRRALGLLCVGKAHTVERDSMAFHSEHLILEVPTVVRLNHYVRRPMPVLSVNWPLLPKRPANAVFFHLISSPSLMAMSRGTINPFGAQLSQLGTL